MASATACDCPSTEDRSTRPIMRRNMYSISGRRGLGGLLHGVGPVLGDEVGRVQALGDDHHHRLDRGELFLEGERSLGGACARLVGVEGEDGALGEPAELAEVPLPQRRAAGGDRVLDPGLHQPDHVGVALDHEDLARSRATA